MPPPQVPSGARPLKPAKGGRATETSSGRKKSSNARISAACEACKKRKTKCTGAPSPCQLCESLGTECIIDLSLDMRRKVALQRTIDESRNYQDVLNLLLDNIRDGPSPRLDSLFEYIRSGATNQDVAFAVQQQFSRDGDEDGDRSIGDGIDGVGLFLEDFKTARSPSGFSNSDSAPPEFEKGKSAELLQEPISKLLFSLKNCSQPQGDAILRRHLALKFGEKVVLPPWSPNGRSPWEGAGPGINPPSAAERAMWHPVLQVRSQSSREEHPQLSRHGSLQRFSEAGPNLDSFHAQAVVSNSPVPIQPLSSQYSHHQLNTNPPPHVSTMPLSPLLPYFELINKPLPDRPEANAWDLSVAQEDQLTRLRIPRHLVVPLVISDDSPMSRMYTDYLHGARSMLEGGVPADDVLGHTERVAVDLFFRPRQTHDRFDCASWACEMSRSYEADIFVQLATACLLTHMMRWLLVPSLENYKRIPDMMKPTPSQCMIPHIGAIETLPLPPVREAAINRLRDWLTPLIAAQWSVNWNQTVDMAVELDHMTGAIVLTQSFHEHVTVYDNWSVTSQFLDAFPEVAGRVRIHETG